MDEIVGRWGVMWVVDLARYVVAAGVAFGVFWVWGRERFARRRVLGKVPERRVMVHDVVWSMCTVLIFSVVGVGVYYAGRAGILRRVEELPSSAAGWGWFAVTVVLLVVLQDTYFYWTHRAMHHRRLFRFFHAVHHRARVPSPWTAYAFAPPEALVHAAFVPLVWLVVPMHELAVFLFLLFMIARNVLGHLSLELFPVGFSRDGVLGWTTTTTHHSLHHLHPRHDFGLYFTLWDRLMGTTHPRYHEVFDGDRDRARSVLRGDGGVPRRSAGDTPVHGARAGAREGVDRLGDQPGASAAGEGWA